MIGCPDNREGAAFPFPNLYRAGGKEKAAQVHCRQINHQIFERATYVEFALMVFSTTIFIENSL
jgi:hypothetical protein